MKVLISSIMYLQSYLKKIVGQPRAKNKKEEKGEENLRSIVLS